jgi:hypothetical protein
MKTSNPILTYALMLIWAGITLMSVAGLESNDVAPLAQTGEKQHRNQIQPSNRSDYHRQLLGLPPFLN